MQLYSGDGQTSQMLKLDGRKEIEELDIVTSFLRALDVDMKLFNIGTRPYKMINNFYNLFKR